MRAGAFLFDDDEEASGGVATLDGGDDAEGGERKEEYLREWPNKLFVAETLEAFPDAAVADVEQARVSVFCCSIYRLAAVSSRSRGGRSCLR